jgi:hypothetical protein
MDNGGRIVQDGCMVSFNGIYNAATGSISITNTVQKQRLFGTGASVYAGISMLD